MSETGMHYIFVFYTIWTADKITQSLHDLIIQTV